jgi:hypothetical protein
MRYQLLILGPLAGEHEEALRAECHRQFEHLGLNPEDFQLVTSRVDPDLTAFDNPLVVAWFGELDSKDVSATDIDLAGRLLKLGRPVFPVVDTIINYTSKVPAILHPINAYALDTGGLAGLVQRVLAEWGLTPMQRKAFISYRRVESEGLAIQLFSLLSLRGFRVFLDTASVESGVIFQDDLWDQMSDTDLIVFLGTPQALGSDWVRQEVARANTLGLGVVQLIWPEQGMLDPANFDKAVKAAKLLEDFSMPFQLEAGDLLTGARPEDTTFASSREPELMRFIEDARIKSLGSRQTRLVAEFVKAAELEGHQVTTRPGGSVELSKNGAKSGLAMIHLGVPGSESLHDAEDKFPSICSGLQKKNVRLLYNIAGQTVRRRNHLEWLNQRVEIKSVDLENVAPWLRGTP